MLRIHGWAGSCQTSECDSVNALSLMNLFSAGFFVSVSSALLVAARLTVCSLRRSSCCGWHRVGTVAASRCGISGSSTSCRRMAQVSTGTGAQTRLHVLRGLRASSCSWKGNPPSFVWHCCAQQSLDYLMGPLLKPERILALYGFQRSWISCDLDLTASWVSLSTSGAT